MNTVTNYVTDNFLVNGLKSIIFQGAHQAKPSKPIHIQGGPNISPAVMKTLVKQGNVFIRLAGLYGATAVMMGAYGTHVFYPRQDVPQELKKVFQTANQFHFFHSLALLGVPLTSRPQVVGVLLTLGMTVFCGSCYYYAMTGDPNVRVVTPYGGVLMMIGWLAMLL